MPEDERPAAAAAGRSSCGPSPEVPLPTHSPGAVNADHPHARHPGPHRLVPGPRPDGDEPGVRHPRGARRARVHRHHPPGRRAGLHLPRHGRGLRSLRQRGAAGPRARGARGRARPRRRRDQVRLQDRERRDDGARQPAGARPRGRRGLAPPPRHRPHRPPLPAPRRPGGADRGRRRRHGRPGPRGEGALPRPLRGRRADHPPRARRAPDRSAPERVLAVGAQPGAAHHPAAARAGDRPGRRSRRSGAAS